MSQEEPVIARRSRRCQEQPTIQLYADALEDLVVAGPGLSAGVSRPRFDQRCCRDCGFTQSSFVMSALCCMGLLLAQTLGHPKACCTQRNLPSHRA